MSRVRTGDFPVGLVSQLWCWMMCVGGGENNKNTGRTGGTPEQGLGNRVRYKCCSGFFTRAFTKRPFPRFVKEPAAV